MRGWLQSSPTKRHNRGWLRVRRSSTPKSGLRADASWTCRAKAARFGQRELTSDGSVGEFLVVDVDVVAVWFLKKVS